MVESDMKKNIQEQLDRLLSQLTDLEEVKDSGDVTEDEYK